MAFAANLTEQLVFWFGLTHWSTQSKTKQQK